MTRALFALLLLAWAPAARADTYDLGVPRGSRQDVGDRYVSGRGFRDTYDWYAKLLDRRGALFHAVPPTHVRGVDLGRLLSDDPRSPWLAVHVYRLDGKTLIFFVKRPAASVPAAAAP